MRALCGLSLLLLSGCAGAAPVPPAPVKPTVHNAGEQRAVEFRVCRAKGASKASAWEGAVAQFVGSAARSSGAFAEVRVAFAPCTESPATCYASSDIPIVYCNGGMLERLAKSSAALAVFYGQSGRSRYADLAGDDKRGPAADAFQFSWSNAGTPEFHARVDALRQADIVATLAGDPAEPLPQLYAAIGTLVFQYVVGHETTHAHRETCAVEDKSGVEASGLFDAVVAIDGGATLFCPNELAVNEVRADRCALRQLRSTLRIVDRALSADGAELARRGTSALLSWYAFAGYVEQPTAPRVASFVQPGYVRGPLRGLLIASELATGLVGPKVCGEAARLFTLGTQEHFGRCERLGMPAGGDVPEVLLNQLSPGVERGWATNRWGPDSFACEVPASVRP